MPNLTVDELEQVKTAREAFENELKGQFERVVDDLVNKIEEQCSEHRQSIERLRLLVRETCDLTGDTGLASRFERLRHLSETMSSQMETIEGFHSNLEQNTQEMSEDVADTVESLNEETMESLTSCGTDISEQLETTAHVIQECSSTFTLRIESERDRVVGKLNDLLHGAVPGRLIDQTEEFKQTVNTFTENGIGQIGQFTKQIDQVTEQIRSFTSLYLEVKPVLDLMRKEL